MTNDLWAIIPKGALVAALGALICLTAHGAALGTSLRATADILPPDALAKKSGHPLDAKIRRFLADQAKVEGFADSGLTSKDYLKFISGQVAAFRKCQDASGAIIDPVQKVEWQYSTPCYALSVALLVSTGYDRDPDLLASGIRAMDLSVTEMHENRCAQNHGEFFIQPVMLALDLYGKLAPAEQVATWRKKLSELDAYALYPDNLRRRKSCYNHNVAALAGEWLRIKGDLKGDTEFFETHLAHHIQYLNPPGMYQDNPGLPLVYDEFTRQFLDSILVEGYQGKDAARYKDAMWRGAWTSLLMQSPFGECPTGGRSAQHIWNEAQCAVTYEICASQYARKGRTAEAGAFKRAAHKALACMNRWLRPDGSGYIVKNRYPIEAQHGYERYSAQSQYNLLACWLLAVAYLYADDPIPERPCPSEIGGFVVPIVGDFHKVFANAGGTYVEYDTRAYLHYNPTGLIRIHIKGSNPQLGPSDGVVHKFDSKTKEDLGGENMAVGPAWHDSAGEWHRLADYNGETEPKVTVLEEKPTRVRFRVVYEGDLGGAQRVSETITVEPSGVTVEDSIQGKGLESMRVYFPMLVFDGLEATKVGMSGSAVSLHLRDGGVRSELLSPKGVSLQRTGKRLDFRNGEAEGAYADIPGLKAEYRITAE